MLNSLATGFERKVLFGFGRHFWNVVGIIGVSVFSVGVIFALEPDTKVKSITDWIFDESNSLVSARSIRKDYLNLKNQINQKSAEEFKSSICITFRSWYCTELLKSYEQYTDGVQSQGSKTVRKMTAPLLIYWGAGTVAAVSVISAILAVERNTRKD